MNHTLHIQRKTINRNDFYVSRILPEDKFGIHNWHICEVISIAQGSYLYKFRENELINDAWIDLIRQALIRFSADSNLWVVTI